MEHMLYWLWLTSKKGIAADKISKLLDYFGSVENIYSAKSYNNIYGIASATEAVLLDKDLTKAKKMLDETLRMGAKILLYDDELYPEILKNMHTPPYVLYVQGKYPNFDEVLSIGIVGTRACTKYGEAVTARISSSLAKNGIITVSGMAAGIDTVSAWSTIDAGGIAVGVIGCGIDQVYPSENLELAKAMIEKGCIISEFPPGIPPLRNNFPLRNRIIAGLSRGILVTEAPEKSGALITAKFALENDRDVFAIPRNITDEKYLGTNILIQQGAKLVNSAEDIIKEYPYAAKVSPSNKQSIENTETKADTKKYDSLNEKDKSIVTLLLKADMQVDEIARELKIPVGDVNTRLMLLEVGGYVKKMPGNRYQLKI